jgi:phage terminase small subunit
LARRRFREQLPVRGRKPKPESLRALHGYPRQQKKPPPEPKPPGALWEAPDSLLPGQRKSWDYAVRNAPPGILKRIDQSVLRAWCVADDAHRQASAELGEVMVEADGKRGPNPA